MNNLLTVLPFCANDAILCEHLCDWIFLLNKRVQKGHCLLIVSGDVHAELWEKVKIAAEVAFLSVEMIVAPHLATGDRNQIINNMFSVASEQVSRMSRLPWLWLEPDAVPIQAGWLEELWAFYEDQPRRYAGPFFQLKQGELIMSRIAIYPPDAHKDLQPFFKGNVAFNVSAHRAIGPMATIIRSKHGLIQETAYTDDSCKIAENAVVVHHDKNGLLMNKLRPQFEEAALRKKK